MQGYLHKRGRGRTFSFVKPWAERYFKLDADKKELSYFLVQNGNEQKKGTIQVNGCAIVEIKHEKSGKQFSFEIISGENTSQEEVVTLSASDAGSLMSWLHALSLNGQNEVRRLPNNRVDVLAETSMSQGDCLDQVLRGRLFKKTIVAWQPQAGGGSRVWAKRDFTLDSCAKTLTLFHIQADTMRRRPVETLSVAGGGLREALQVHTGRAHSFQLTVRSGSAASSDQEVLLAAEDADAKTRLLEALCGAMGCAVMPAAAADWTQQGNTRLLLPSPAEHGGSSPPNVESSIHILDVSLDGSHSQVDVRVDDDRAADSSPQVAPSNECDNNASTLHGYLGKIQERLLKSNDELDVRRAHVQRRRMQRERPMGSGSLAVALGGVHQDLCPARHRPPAPGRVEAGDCKESSLVLDSRVGSFDSERPPVASEVEDVDQEGLTGDSQRGNLNLSIWPSDDVQVRVVKVLTPGKSMRKYLFMQEQLFHRATSSVELEAVLQKMAEFEEDYFLDADIAPAAPPPPLLLPAGGGDRCSLEDVARFIQLCEQQSPECATSDVRVLLEVELARASYRRRMSCSLSHWSKEAAEQLKLDSQLKLNSKSMLEVENLLSNKVQSVLLDAVALLSVDQIKIQKCHFSLVSPTKHAEIIARVVRNYERRAHSGAAMSPSIRSSKRAPPTPPPPMPRAAAAHVHHAAVPRASFVPPPPRSSVQRTGTVSGAGASAGEDSPLSPATVPEIREDEEMLYPVQDRVEGEIPRNLALTDTIPPENLASYKTLPSALSSSKREEEDICETENDSNSSISHNPFEVDESNKGFIYFKRAVLKNKWCAHSLKRLATLTTLKKVIDRGGVEGCASFLCSCCPTSYLAGVRRGEAKGVLARSTGMSVCWLEAVAMRLGTFWPVSERKHLVEVMYCGDADGDQHVGWLSVILVSFSAMPETCTFVK